MTKIIEEEKPKIIEIKRTKAEIAFQKMQEKMVSNYLNILHFKIISFNYIIIFAAN